MGGKIIKSKSGFTLIELMIVIIIIGVLLAIAIARFVNVAKTAEDSVLKYNGTYIVKVFALNIANYDDENRYIAPSGGDFDYSEDSLNNFLEKNLEDYQKDSNKDSIKNPKSRSMKILHGDNPSGGSISDGKNPAVFITGNSAYSHSGGGSTDNLICSIVAYFNQAEPYNVQVYYIDRNGDKSKLLSNFN